MVAVEAVAGLLKVSGMWKITGSGKSKSTCICYLSQEVGLQKKFVERSVLFKLRALVQV
jgi:hypothetical protein